MSSCYMRKAKTQRVRVIDDPLESRKEIPIDEPEVEPLLEQMMSAQELMLETALFCFFVSLIHFFFFFLLLTRFISREEACETLSVVISNNPQAIHELMKGSLCDRLVTRICDSKAGVRLAALTATKILCQKGGDEVVAVLVKMDVMSPLLDLFGKMRVSQPIVDASVRTTVFSIVEEVLKVLQEICQRSEHAADVVSRSPLCSSMADFLDFSLPISMDMRCAAAELLQVLVDDSPTLVNAMRSGPKVLSLLKEVVGNDSNDIFLRSLCAGILLVVEDQTNDAISRCCSVLFPILSLKLPHVLLSLEPDATAAAKESDDGILAEGNANENVRSEDEPPNMEKEAMDVDIDLPAVPGKNVGPAQGHLNQALSQWARSADAQQQALETLANLFCGVHTENSIIAKAASTAFPHLVYLATVPIAQIDAKFGDRLLSTLPQLDSCMEKIQQLQLISLTCINNVFISVDPGMLKKEGKLAGFWQGLVTVLRTVTESLVEYRTAGGTEVEDELCDIICQCLWSLARTCADEPCLPVEPDHVSVIAKALSFHLSATVDTALAGGLGCLSGYIRRSDTAINGVASILLTCGLNPQASPLLIAESLNALVDLFSDDSTHKVFVSLQVGQKLKSALSNAEVAVTRLVDNEDKEHLDEVIENVRAFLDYKKVK